MATPWTIEEPGSYHLSFQSGGSYAVAGRRGDLQRHLYQPRGMKKGDAPLFSFPVNATVTNAGGGYTISDSVTAVYSMLVSGDAALGTYTLGVSIQETTGYNESENAAGAATPWTIEEPGSYHLSFQFGGELCRCGRRGDLQRHLHQPRVGAATIPSPIPAALRPPPRPATPGPGTIRARRASGGERGEAPSRRRKRRKGDKPHY